MYANLLLLTSLLAINGATASPQTPEAEADLITSLPGLPTLPQFDQYSGYVSVSDERDLFYYFAAADTTEDGDSLPLVLWLNGGPGCSSLGGGLSELGPFNAAPPGEDLLVNEHAWNKVANTVFLESPAGVGFSTSTNATDYTTVGDERTAQDTLNFVRGFLQRFPQFENSDFWIAGESYVSKPQPQTQPQSKPSPISNSNFLPLSHFRLDTTSQEQPRQ
jgi:serine carboxypeptidase-like clade 2